MSRIENTRLISAVYCDCKKCFHSVNKNGCYIVNIMIFFHLKRKNAPDIRSLIKGKRKEYRRKRNPKE